MRDLTALLDEIERLVAEIQQLDEGARAKVSELLGAVDVLHRFGLQRLAAAVGEARLREARDDAVVSWLLDAYGIAVDERAEAASALAEVRPYVESQGGQVELVDARDGVVRVRMAGACAGCSASALGLRDDVEQALRDNWAGFVRLETEEPPDPAAPRRQAVIDRIGRRTRRGAAEGR